MGIKGQIAAIILALSLEASPASAAFNLKRTYSGSNFLDQFYFRDVSCNDQRTKL
jgi:hypothetical protein